MSMVVIDAQKAVYFQHITGRLKCLVQRSCAERKRQSDLSSDVGPSLFEHFPQDRPMTAFFLLTIAADREMGLVG